MVLLKDLLDQAKEEQRLKRAEERERLKEFKRQYVKRGATGIKHVYYQPCNHCVKGFRWRYKFKDFETTSVELKVLKEKVLSKNREWIIISEEDFIKTCKIDGGIVEDLR